MPPTHGVNAVPALGTDSSADQAPREYNDYDSAIGDIVSLSFSSRFDGLSLASVLPFSPILLDV